MAALTALLNAAVWLEQHDFDNGYTQCDQQHHSYEDKPDLYFTSSPHSARKRSYNDEDTESDTFSVCSDVYDSEGSSTSSGKRDWSLSPCSPPHRTTTSLDKFDSSLNSITPVTSISTTSTTPESSTYCTYPLHAQGSTHPMQTQQEEQKSMKIRVRISLKATGVKRRECHNIYEKNRRAQLKNSLENLKDIVPSLECVDKPSTLDVLQHSLQLIERLRERERVLCRERKEEEDKRDILVKKLEELKRGEDKEV